VARHQLLDLLWERADPEASAQTLRQTVFTLRKRLGADCVGFDGASLWVTDRITVDVDAFEQAVITGDFEHAWALYGGPFLGSEAVRGTPAFAHWVDQHRTRLALRWRSVGDHLARLAVADRRLPRAIELVETVLREFPDDLDIWELLLEARVLAGDRSGARVDARTLAELVEREELSPSASLHGLLRRLGTSASNSLLRDGSITRETPPPPGHHLAQFLAHTPAGGGRIECVGREPVLHELLASWQVVGNGRGVVHALLGSAGIGKTRILQEFFDRLTDLGASVMMARATPSDRHVSYALIASLVEAISSLPGSAGISPASAGVLVDLAPSLSNNYPAAQRLTATAEELPRLRLLAVRELLEVVADEQPLAILLDDAHWSDTESRQLLASLIDRLQRIPVLLTVAYRQAHAFTALPSDAVVTEVPPLSISQIATLLDERRDHAPAARSPEHQSADPVEDTASVIHAATGGVPLLVIAALELAMSRGWVERHDGRWLATDPPQLRAELSGGELLERLLHAVSSEGLHVLVAAALFRQPMSPSLVEHVVPGASAPAVVAQLEQRGLLTRSSAGCEIAHDLLADAVLRITGVADQSNVARNIARGVFVEGGVRELEAGARVLLRTHARVREHNRPVDDDFARVFHRWMHKRNRRRLWQRPRLAAAQFLGDDARIADVHALAASISTSDRVRHGYPRVAGAGTIGLAIVGITTVGQLLIATATAPATNMEVDPPSTELGFLWGTSVQDPETRTMPELENRLDLRVSFHDDRGLITRDAPSFVRVRLADAAPNMRLVGDSILPVLRGQARSSTLRIRGVGRFRLEVRADSFAQRTAIMYAVGRDPHRGEGQARELRLLEGTINGQRFDSSSKRITVAPGAVLSGMIRFRSVTDVRFASIMMGAVGMWGDRTTNFLALEALPPFGEMVDTANFIEHSTQRRLRAPTRPGDYRLLFVWDTETAMRFIASRTNWQMLTPRWNDGNDLADFPTALLDSLAAGGVLMEPVTFLVNPGRSALPRRRQSREVPSALVGDVLHVRVSDRTSTTIDP
jgi:DNA-binding SARP family transcriptional activator